MSTCVYTLVGWLVPVRFGVCLSASARGLGVLWASSWGGCVLGALWARDRGGAPLVGGGSHPASARAYVRFAGGLGIWRVWPSWSSCSASFAVMTRPQIGGHASAYSPPAHTARSCWASCGADTGCVVCSLSGLVYPSVVSSASGPIAWAQRWVSSDRVAAMWLTCWSPRYGSPVAVVSPCPSPSFSC